MRSKWSATETSYRDVRAIPTAATTGLKLFLVVRVRRAGGLDEQVEEVAAAFGRNTFRQRVA